MRRILIVDDHNSHAEGVANALRQAGSTVDVLSKASEVHEQIAKFDYDLALVDMLFPDEEQSGLDVLETISMQRQSTRLVLFTAGEEVRKLHLAQAFKQFDIQGALPKGLHLADIVQRVEQILNGFPYFDPELEAFRPRSTDDPCIALMKTPAHEAIWIALAEGRTRVKEIAGQTGYKESTIRISVGEMADKLVISGLAESCGRNLASLAAFAISHDEFFLNWKWRTSQRKRFRAPKVPKHKRPD